MKNKFAQAYAQRKRKPEEFLDGQSMADEVLADNEEFLSGQNMDDDYDVDNEDFLSSNTAQRIISNHIKRMRK